MALKETAIFFDLDDTLYDRSQPFKQAFQEKYSKYCASDLDGKNISEGMSSNLESRAYWACEKRGNEVFLPSQRGEITMEEMYIYRYQKGFADVGISITAEEALAFQEVYREKQKLITLGKGVPELLDFCRDHCKCIGLITNGPALKQQGKLATLELSRWIPENLTLISGVLKIDKPDPAIFHLAETRSDTAPENMLYVGDSLPNDIRPAIALGWKTIFLNRKNVSLEKEERNADLILEGEAVLTPEHLMSLY